MHSLLLVAILLATSAALPDDHLVGQKVMVIHWQSKIIDDDKKLSMPVYLGDIFTVERIDGRLLRVKNGWLHDSDALPLDEAIDYLSAKVKEHPESDEAYHDRASAYVSLGQFDKALDDENKNIELYANAPAYIRAYGYANRGHVWLSKRAFERAISDYNQAIELDPKNPYSYNNRGLAYRYTGKYEQALEDFNREIELDPSFPHSFGNRAWIWATCPDPTLRDPNRAIESATHACELCDWHSGGELDTLAAAYASKGDFDSAIKWQTKAVEMGLESHFIKKPEDLQTRLELYKNGKPFIDTPQP